MGYDEATTGLETGLAEDHSATCHLGNDLDGNTAEAPAGISTNHKTKPFSQHSQKTKQLC